MSLDILHRCSLCSRIRKGWCFPDRVANLFEPDGPTKKPIDAESATCMFCEGLDKGLVDIITATERADVEVIRRLKLTFHDVLRELLEHVQLTCENEWGAMPKFIRSHVIRIMYRWHHMVNLQEILEFVPWQMQDMSKTWKTGFLKRLAEYAVSGYVHKAGRVSSDIPKSRRKDEVSEMAKRIGEMEDPTPADIVSILKELDEKLRNI
ncbi:hypothetical protein F4776DRAFT_333580 [Hypoxylon sp. NC0597]|nr:hypothetical protein F4776DRAFT_333580 [Hypoxylon sp. NC0597]